MDGRTDGWMGDGCMDGCIDIWMDGWMTNGWMYAFMNAWAMIQPERLGGCSFPPADFGNIFQL
eukprot:4819008-Karenia_brevis.AAC.1